MFGSPEMEQVLASTPAFLSNSKTGSARSVLRPVTTIARLPDVTAAGGSSFSIPRPKMIRPAVANSNMAHQPESLGNMLVNFTLERGCAIIGATASRHAA